MDPERARIILEELTERRKQNPLLVAEEIRGSFFARQAAFFLHPAKRKAAACSRRAGKTAGVARKHLSVCLENAGCLTGYITRTRDQAKRLLWTELIRFSRKYEGIFKATSFNATELTCTLSNGSQIWLAGADNEAAIEKFRGPHYHLFTIDEAQTFGNYLERLIDEVIEPALLDDDGELNLLGTPNAGCMGTFHDATNTNQGRRFWHADHWTLLENPFLKNAVEWLDGLRERKGWAEDNPVYQREYLGKWVKSLDSLVYRIDAGLNTTQSLPDYAFDYVLSIDLGFRDATAFVILAFARNAPQVFIVETYKQTGMDVTDIVHRVEKFNERYTRIKGRSHPFIKILMDTGGLGKTIAVEIQRRHGIGITPAEKQKKYDFIELMNDDFVTGRLLVLTPACNDYLEEANLLQWDEDHLREAEGYENHLCDASLYGWRECLHYTYRPESSIKALPSFTEAETRMLEVEKKRVIDKNAKAWWLQ